MNILARLGGGVWAYANPFLRESSGGTGRVTVTLDQFRVPLGKTWIRGMTATGRLVFASGQASGIIALAGVKPDPCWPLYWTFWREFGGRYLTLLCQMPPTSRQLDPIPPPDATVAPSHTEQLSNEFVLLLRSGDGSMMAPAPTCCFQSESVRFPRIIQLLAILLMTESSTS